MLFKQKTAYDMRISDWSSDVCSSDLVTPKMANAEPLSFRVLRHRHLRHDHYQHHFLCQCRICSLALHHLGGRLYARLAGMDVEALAAAAAAVVLSVVHLAFHTQQEPVPRTVEKRSEEHTSELQSLMRISYAVFCLKKKKITKTSNID